MWLCSGVFASRLLSISSKASRRIVSLLKLSSTPLSILVAHSESLMHSSKTSCNKGSSKFGTFSKKSEKWPFSTGSKAELYRNESWLAKLKTSPIPIKSESLISTEVNSSVSKISVIWLLIPVIIESFTKFSSKLELHACRLRASDIVLEISSFTPALSDAESRTSLTSARTVSSIRHKIDSSINWTCSLADKSSLSSRLYSEISVVIICSDNSLAVFSQRSCNSSGIWFISSSPVITKTSPSGSTPSRLMLSSARFSISESRKRSGKTL